ncbi:hypothetical protein BD626DRAFT_491119 [Schizophyllum amplum]|uniref:Uncharacterized protein n=1 Tax=Schizophyllum amplum TaxID=97359 RepID=A0A550CHE9_9AGAR|nr:hypothetical protein BD626DRAFT_491119 [Auriculariopsis ampla]
MMKGKKPSEGGWRAGRIFVGTVVFVALDAQDAAFACAPGSPGAALEEGLDGQRTRVFGVCELVNGAIEGVVLRFEIGSRPNEASDGRARGRARGTFSMLRIDKALDAFGQARTGIEETGVRLDSDRALTLAPYHDVLHRGRNQSKWTDGRKSEAWK